MFAKNITCCFYPQNQLIMDHDSGNLGNDIQSITRDAKNIMLLSLISLPVTPLFLITLIYYVIYSNKLKKLKSNQSLSSKYSRLKAKTTKELRSIKLNSESSEKSLAGLLLAHRTASIVLIVIGIVIVLMITFIGLSYKMGWV